MHSTRPITTLNSSNNKSQSSLRKSKTARSMFVMIILVFICIVFFTLELLSTAHHHHRTEDPFRAHHDALYLAERNENNNNVNHDEILRHLQEQQQEIHAAQEKNNNDEDLFSEKLLQNRNDQNHHENDFENAEENNNYNDDHHHHKRNQNNKNYKHHLPDENLPWSRVDNEGIADHKFTPRDAESAYGSFVNDKTAKEEDGSLPEKFLEENLQQQQNQQQGDLIKSSRAGDGDDTKAYKGENLAALGLAGRDQDQNQNQQQLRPRRPNNIYSSHAPHCQAILPILKTSELFYSSEFLERKLVEQQKKKTRMMNTRRQSLNKENTDQQLPLGFKESGNQDNSRGTKTARTTYSFNTDDLLAGFEFPHFTRRNKNKRPDLAIVMLSSSLSKNHRDEKKIKQKSPTKRQQHQKMRMLSIINKIQYAQIHGYDFILEDASSFSSSSSTASATDPRRDVRWSKIRVVQKWLSQYKYLVMIDEDTLFMNMAFKLESFILPSGKIMQMLASRRANFKMREEKRRHAASKKQQQDEDDDGFFKEQAINSKKDEEKAKEKQFEFEKKLYEKYRDEILNKTNIVLSRDFKNINTGVVFYKNTPWTHDFLKRAWSVSTSDAEAQGYHDQGAFISLLSARPFQRTRQEVEQDEKHIMIVSDPKLQIFNRYPENNIIAEHNIDRYKFRPGYDFILHSASCHSFPGCPKEFEFFFEQSLCSRQALMKRAGETSGTSSLELMKIMKNLKSYQDRLDLEDAATTMFDAAAFAPIVDDTNSSAFFPLFTTPKTFYPPDYDEEKVTFPPLLSEIPE